MKKIPTIFVRDWNGDRSKVTQERNPECDWVFRGEGIATVKLDGTACLIQDGVLYCRYDAKNGKSAPENFVPAQDEADPETGHWPGWVPAGNDPQYKWQRSAYDNSKILTELFADGTYEACGPHFQGNPEGLEKDVLLRHGLHKYVGVPTEFEDLKEFLSKLDIEGLVWHHPDGRMAKIKKKDFGLKRKP